MTAKTKKLREIQTGFFSNKPPLQLLKWIGSKHRYAMQIVSAFPRSYNTYIEPFVGSGSVLGTLAPERALAGDVLNPLIELWKLVQESPDSLIDYYSKTIKKYMAEPDTTYKDVQVSFNQCPNPFGLLFISRSCYGGVVRFTKQGSISTPRGPHTPIPALSFAKRVYEWQQRVARTKFLLADFRDTMEMAKAGDIVYCDPPYFHSQSILYGSQGFNLPDLWEAVDRCATRGAQVFVSIDGKKKSGRQDLHIQIPRGLFRQEIWINLGSSMLKRFQKEGEIMEGEDVHDRLLIT